MVFSQGIVSMMTNEEGRVAFYGVPGNEYAIEIRHAGHERCEHPVVAPAAGEERLETIDLVPLRPRPSLVVVIRGPDGGPIRKAGFGFYDPPDEHGFFRIRRDSEARDGRHVLANLDPGRFRVLVRPGGEFLGGRSYWLEEEFLVTLPTEGEVVRELTARPGGRLRLTAKDGSGRHPMTTVRIRDVTGEDVPVELVERQQGMASFGGSLLQQEGAELLTPLPAGRYEVTFSAKSCREATVSVSIEAGKTAVVTVTLEPR